AREWARGEFGLSDAPVLAALDVLGERVDAFKDLSIGCLPVDVLVPRARVPYELHAAASASSSTNSCPTPSPASISAIRRRNSRPLAPRDRYSVSRHAS